MSVPVHKRARLIQTDAYDGQIKHYREAWGMTGNPFWYNCFFDCDGGKEWKPENLQVKRMVEVFISMSSDEGHLTGIVIDDLLEMGKEHGNDEGMMRKVLESALQLGMLSKVQHEGQEYIMLSEKVVSLCW